MYLFLIYVYNKKIDRDVHDEGVELGKARPSTYVCGPIDGHKPVGT